MKNKLKQIIRIAQKTIQTQWANYQLFRNKKLNYKSEGEMSSSNPFLISTEKGLFLFREGKFIALLKGRFFGITLLDDDEFLVYQQIGNGGRVLKCKIEKNRITRLNRLIEDLPSNIHQIIYFDQQIFLANTKQNCISVFDVEGRFIRDIYPVGKLANGRASENYAHLNSIYPASDKVLIVAHNYSQYSNRDSELLVLNRATDELEGRVSNMGQCSHNVILFKDFFLVCNSLKGQLLNHGKVVFNQNAYLRGLAMDDTTILVGGSMYGKRAQRTGTDCFVYSLDHTFQLKGTLTLQGVGPCFDLRFMEVDYGIEGKIEKVDREWNLLVKQ